MTESPRSSRGVRWSVRSRILASILLVAALGMTVAGATSYLLQRERTIRAIDDRLISRVESAQQVVTGEVTARESDEPAPSRPRVRKLSLDEALGSVLSHVPANTNESAVGILDGQAKWLPGTPVEFRVDRIPGLVDRVVAETQDGEVKMGTSLSDAGHYRYIAAPVIMNAENDEAVGIYLAAVDVDAELEGIEATFSTYAVVAAIALVAIALVGWFVAGRLLRPIRNLREAASRITATDLSERIPVAGTDDVSELTVTVNDMLARLDGAMTGQRQLLDDVRHELKTPITIVRGHLEVLDSQNANDVETTRSLAIDELDRMARLVDDIESLAETQLALAYTRTDAAIFTSEVFAKASVIPGHDWVLVETAPTTVSIDAGRITQAWLQLIDNAAKYSPAGSTIKVGSTLAKSTVEFWVSDNGPGIAPAAVERIFERFGRVDTGRGIRGSGLGLPIVKSIAQAHGGTVSLRSGHSGSRFGIVVPALETIDTEQLERISQ
jgi:two-component system OmpR family sensor kinase